jgi:hypothetical protein
MAIQITRELTVSPTPTTLPKRLSFIYGMVSNKPSEAVEVTYRIDGTATALRFDDGDGPVTEVTRTETATQQAQEFEDRVSMVGTPNGAFEDVEIVQRVVDSTGDAIPGLVVLTVRR